MLDIGDMGSLTVVYAICEVMTYVAPCGNYEIKVVQAYIRSPGSAQTSAEVVTQLCTWLAARRRASPLGILELSCPEEVLVLETMIQHAETRAERL